MEHQPGGTVTLARLFIVTGDASGDIHAADVVQALQKLSPDTQIQAIGGTALAGTGIPIFHDQRKMGALGIDVLKAIPSHLFLGYRLLNHFKTQWRPDAVLLVDYGGFNLWLAPKLKAMGIKVFYYIPPQVWASRKGRLNIIKKNVDHVFCIFPFEKSLYENAGIPVTYVGHPTAAHCQRQNQREAFCAQYGLDSNRPIMGLFPGSRKKEIAALLPPMLKAAALIQQENPDTYQFVMAQSNAVDTHWFQSLFESAKPASVSFRLIPNQSHAILEYSHIAIAASGTVTLEAALYQTPVVILYSLPAWAYWLFQRFAYVKHIGLPNLLLPQPILPEVIAEHIRPEVIVNAIRQWLTNAEYDAVKNQLAQLRPLLTLSTSPVHQVAGNLLQFNTAPPCR